MAFVSVPKDLTKVKNKVVLNLTKRQIICLTIAAAIGLPFYFLTRGTIGTSNAATGINGKQRCQFYVREDQVSFHLLRLA